MNAHDLTKTVRELKELKAMVSEIAEEITSLEDILKAEMTSRDTDELIVDVFKVRWTSVVSNRFDATAFKATHAVLYSQYVKPIETKRFSIN